MNTQEIKSLLRAFVAQRPGFENANYGSLAAFRADQKRAMRDKADALALINAFPDEADPRFLVGVLSSGNRLSLEGGKLEYITGQYYCTEYRAAVCRAVSDALHSLSWAQSQERLAETRKLAETRQRMARIVGRGCANRWFS